MVLDLGIYNQPKMIIQVDPTTGEQTLLCHLDGYPRSIGIDLNGDILVGYEVEYSGGKITRIIDEYGNQTTISSGNYLIDPENIIIANYAIPSISVKSPNGAEKLYANSIYEIRWTSEGRIENVGIEYSVDSGSNWIEIEANTENDGSYNWDVPCDASDESLIRISAVDSNASDMSDGVFSIIDDSAPNIEVSVTPNILWPPNHKMVHVTATAHIQHP